MRARRILKTQKLLIRDATHETLSAHKSSKASAASHQPLAPGPRAQRLARCSSPAARQERSEKAVGKIEPSSVASNGLWAAVSTSIGNSRTLAKRASSFLYCY